MKDIYYDWRWCGSHGIGRFAMEIKKSKLNLIDIPLHGNPADKYDVFKLTAVLSKIRGLYFSPGYNAPLFYLKRTVITVHDLNHIDLTYNSSFLKRYYYNFVLKRACKRCAKILTVSDFSKQRIIEWAKIPAEKINVVGNGVSEEFNIDIEPFCPGYPYVFIVGNRKPHKNEERALQAFLNANISRGIKIVFNGSVSSSLKDIIEHQGANERVLFMGHLSSTDLASVYKGAELLLFPSLYEGFGLPVIEAMACGTPVITSNSTSLKEISGDAACLVNPEDIGEITSAIEMVINDVAYKQQLINAGLQRSSIYTWKKTIEKVENAIEPLL
jgi:glycosyltransferase involved in cell wall biosynthesis